MASALVPIIALAIYGPAARKEGVIVATAKTFKQEVLEHDGPVAVQLFDWIIEVPLVPMPVQASAFRTARVWCLTVEFQAVVMFVWYPAGTSSR